MAQQLAQTPPEVFYLQHIRIALPGYQGGSQYFDWLSQQAPDSGEGLPAPCSPESFDDCMRLVFEGHLV
jgi:hypothetical protein